ncbi:MAG: hypothetical protein K2F95_02135 [Alistipes sp.]|nr:hypothetical protein [Alistipes sp.]
MIDCIKIESSGYFAAPAWSATHCAIKAHEKGGVLMVVAIISTGAVILYSVRNFAAGVRLLVKSFAEMVMTAAVRGKKILAGELCN